jgi:hypothetical protein
MIISQVLSASDHDLMWINPAQCALTTGVLCSAVTRTPLVANGDAALGCGGPTTLTWRVDSPSDRVEAEAHWNSNPGPPTADLVYEVRCSCEESESTESLASWRF